MLKIAYRDSILQCLVVYYPYFFMIEVIIIGRLKLKTLEDVYNCYGKENLICLDLLKQIFFYTSKGVQPVFVCESDKENRNGKLVCWFLKSETQWVYQEWKKNRPSEITDEMVN